MRRAPLVLTLALGACGSRSGLYAPSGDAGHSLTGGAGGTPASGGSGGSGGAAGSGGSGGALTCAFGPTPVALAQGLPRAYALAVDETYVYVTTAVDGGTVVRIPKTGGTPLTLLSGLGRPRHLALDANRIWVTSPMDGRVVAVAKDASATFEIIKASPGHPEGIARSNEATFWVRGGPGVKAGALFAWQSASEGAVTLATGLDSPGALAVDGGDAFWIDNTSGGTPGIWHFAPASTAAPQLITALPAANGNDLALDETHVYYAMNAEIGRVPRLGGARQALSPGVFAHAVALGGLHVYWVEGGATSSGRLARMPREGGTADTLAIGLDVPRDVALDDACVYWTNQGVGDASGSVFVRSR